LARSCSALRVEVLASPTGTHAGAISESTRPASGVSSRAELACPFNERETAPCDAEEAELLALEDRSVASGLLRVAVRPWTVPMGFAVGALPSHEER
jgi:hypothetical protein